MAKKPNLLYFNQTLGMGGAESFMSDLLAELRKQGWQVVVTAVHDPFIKLLQSKQVKTEEIPVIIDIVGDYKGLIKGLILWPIAVVIYLKKLAEHKEIDVVLVSGFAEKIFGTLACIIYKKPIVWIEFASTKPLTSKFGGFPGIFYNLFLPFAKAIITSSNYSAKILKNELPKVADKIIVIPCGMQKPNQKIPPKKSNSTTTNIVCVSRLEKGKGQDLLINSIKKVQQENFDIKLKIIGTGETLYSLQKLTKSLNLQNMISFEGYVKDAKAEIAKADILVFPTMWKLEGFGMVAVEAMSLGTPVVAFDFGPIPDIITNEYDGLLAKPGDIDDLANKIIRLINDRDLQQKLIKNAQETFQKKFTIERAGENYQQVLFEAMRHQKAKK